MSCMLRISGRELDLDALLAQIPVEPQSVYRRGEPRLAFRPNGKRHDTSGANFLLSDADSADFDTQKAEVLDILQTDRKIVEQIMALPGVEGGCLDFGIAWNGEAAAQNDYLPPELVRAAGTLGLGIELSHYWVADEE